MLEATGLMVFYENMLALNNVAVQCDENQIVGVFGANSAGKSTLMYTLSGIMRDIQKKELMAGGERITLAGEINFKGQDIIIKQYSNGNSSEEKFTLENPLNKVREFFKEKNEAEYPGLPPVF